MRIGQHTGYLDASHRAAFDLGRAAAERDSEALADREGQVTVTLSREEAEDFAVRSEFGAEFPIKRAIRDALAQQAEGEEDA